MLVSLLSIAVNFGLNWFFRFQLGWDHRGLALSTSLGGDHKFPAALHDDAAIRGAPRNGAMLVTLAKLAVAGAVLAAGLLRRAVGFLSIAPRVCAIWQKAIEVVDHRGAWRAAAFFGAAYLLRVAEVHDVVTLRADVASGLCQ